MASDIYDFGNTPEEENTEEVKTDDEVVTDEVNTDEAPTDEVVAEEENTKEVKTDDEVATDEVKTDDDDLESDIDKESEALDKELADLEKLLEDGVAKPWSSDDDNAEVSGKLQDSVKTIKGLLKKIDTLELEKAERTKFWENAGLSPELIIIKAHYDKAKKWDEASMNKIKELLAGDLWLEVTNQKQVFVSSAISRDTDVNTPSEESWFGWFIM